MLPKSIRFSLIMATKGRVEEISRFVEALDDFACRRAELIIVDQNEDDRLVEVIAEAKRKLIVQHVRSQPGLSHARNVGVRQAAGHIVAFPDDDCWYPANLLQQVELLFNQHQDWPGVTLRLVGPPGEVNRHTRFNKTAGPVTLAKAWVRSCSATMFLRRDDFLLAGGFDESLGLGAPTDWQSAEDIELAVRFARQGNPLWYRPGLVVHHPVMDDQPWPLMADRAEKYGKAIGRVWKIHDFPRLLVNYYLARPLIGAAISLCTGRLAKARYHLAALKGRWAGWRSQIQPTLN